MFVSKQTKTMTTMIRPWTLAVGVAVTSVSTSALIRVLQRARWDRKTNEDPQTNKPRFRTIVWVWTAMFADTIATIAALALACTVVLNRGDAIAGRAAWRDLYSLSPSSTGWRVWALSYPTALVAGATLVAAAWTAYAQVAPVHDGWRYRSRPRSSGDARAPVQRATYAYGLAVYAALGILTVALARDGRWQTAAGIVVCVIPLAIVARALSP